MSTQPISITKQEPPKSMHLVAKLADIVREIDHVEKSGRNDFQKYNYVKAADVAWLVRKALSERNIYLVSDVVEIRNYEIPAREGVMQAVDIKMQFSFFDGDAPETAPIVLHSFGTGTDKGDKAVYKAMTGALKYGLRHAFLIPDESDPEGDEKTDKQTQAAKKFVEEEVERQKAGKKPRNVPDGAEQPPTRVTTLFYTKPERHNGHKAEFVNFNAFIASNLDKETSLRLAFSAYGATKSKDDTPIVPVDKLTALLEKLVGDCGVDVYEGKPL
jgi:hypothetical protein